jgi:hypothetical protein
MLPSQALVPQAAGLPPGILQHPTPLAQPGMLQPAAILQQPGMLSQHSLLQQQQVLATAVLAGIVGDGSEKSCTVICIHRNYL